MRTDAHDYSPQETYGKQISRGNTGEKRAAKIMRDAGYTVTYSEKHPHGPTDLTCKKGKEVRRIQVKRISSRVFRTAKAARNRMRGKPFCIKTIPAGTELWVFDAENNLYKFRR